MLLDAEPTSHTFDPMKNGLKIINGMYGFIQCWKKLCEEDITISVWDTHEVLVAYWDCILLALLAFGDMYQYTFIIETRALPTKLSDTCGVRHHVLYQ